MTEEHYHSFMTSNQFNDQQKRKRTPSQYASRIENFKIDNKTQIKKAKSTKFNDQISSPEESNKNTTGGAINCILPSGKVYALKIVVTKNKSIKKQNKQKAKNGRPELTHTKSKLQKQQDTDKSLLDKFLVACELLQNKSEKESQENNQNLKQNIEYKMIQYEQKVKKERQRQQKWNKCYEKYKLLNEKLQKLQENYVFLV